MKKFKKLAGLLLAMIMVMAMAVTSFAAGTGKITVENTVAGAEYKIYRIFDLESYAGSGETDAHSYKVNSDWTAYFADSAEGLSYFDVDANGYVTAKSGVDFSEFATKALTYAETNSIAAVDTKTSTGSDLEFSGLDLGYYLIDSSVGALCALTTTDPEATVIEKNANPTLVKQVQEGTTWGTENDASIGDTVKFQATITVQGLANSYVMHDTMDSALDFTTVTEVKKGDTVCVESTDYEVVTSPTDSCTFEIKFTDSFCTGLKSGDVITVSYEATLNDTAVAKTAIENKANLSYKDHNNTDKTTTESKTETFTWEMPVLKYGNGDISKVLAGAKFSLYTDESCTNIIKFTDKTGNTYQYDKAGTVTEITTDDTGKFILTGLDAGTYYLKETDAPAGYNKLDTKVKVVIDHDGKITVNESTTEVTQVAVNNNSGTELPSTGGIGTTIFYAAGAVLVLGAAILLVAKKRMSNE